MDKYQQVITSSKVVGDDEQVKKEVEKLLKDHVDENRNVDVYKFMFSCIDLTTLSTTDSMDSVTKFTERVNAFDNEHPELDNVAAICVYPNFATVVSSTLDVTGVKLAVVAGGFPSSQTFTEIKTTETALAVADGADEVDIVMNLGYFFDGNYEDLCDEIEEIKHSAKSARLKVILETGALKSAENIKKASLLSIYSGADFIKTSTGKVYEGASKEAAYVMCQCIKEYYDKFNVMIGFKAAGGVATTEDALAYYTIVKEVLGDKWLSKDYFRLGASRLANILLGDITGETVKFF